MSRTTLNTLTRRDFVKGTTGALAATWITDLAGCRAQPEIPSPSEIGIGVQLNGFRHELAEDYPGTLKKIADSGYKGVEFAEAPEYLGYTARELRTMLDESGLKPCGTHISFRTLLGNELEESLAFNQILGNNKLIIRSMRKERHATREALIDTAHLLNEVAEKLKAFGMRIGIHLQRDFFEKITGAYKWTIFADHTSENVILQVDTATASQMPDIDLVALLKRNPGRFATVHVKPSSSTNPNVYFDNDELDWPAIIEVFRTTAGVEWFIIDNETPGTPPLEASKAACVSFVLKTGVFGLCSCLGDTERETRRNV